MSARARDEFARRFRMLRLSLFPPNPMCRIAPQLSIVIEMPRPRYCDCCKLYGWCTLEMAAYSTSHGFLCEDCAIENDRETEHAWASFYGRY